MQLTQMPLSLTLFSAQSIKILTTNDMGGDNVPIVILSLIKVLPILDCLMTYHVLDSVAKWLKCITITYH